MKGKRSVRVCKVHYDQHLSGVMWIILQVYPVEKVCEIICSDSSQFLD